MKRAITTAALCLGLVAVSAPVAMASDRGGNGRKEHHRQGVREAEEGRQGRFKATSASTQCGMHQGRAGRDGRDDSGEFKNAAKDAGRSAGDPNRSRRRTGPTATRRTRSASASQARSRGRTPTRSSPPRLASRSTTAARPGGRARGRSARLPSMAVRHAETEDVADLLPLFRAYCDFYEANPDRRRPRGDGPRRDRPSRRRGVPVGCRRRRRGRRLRRLLLEVVEPARRSDRLPRRPVRPRRSRAARATRTR